MYAEHNSAIANGMQSDLAIFKRGVLFAILSIRQAITSVPEQLEQVERGDYSPLFGFKLDAFDYLSDYGATLWRDVKAAPDNGARLNVLTRVPGLGIVKAGFVLQLMGYDVACLDSRNVKREGRKPRAFRSDGIKGKSGPAFQRKIARYLGEVEGKAANYWDAWCSDVSRVYRTTAEEISALHLAILPSDYVPF